MENLQKKLKPILIGTSAGGLNVLVNILSNINNNLEHPIIIVQHIAQNDDYDLSQYFQHKLNKKVIEVESGMKIEKYKRYIAPADYHILIEEDETFSISLDEKVCYSRPSIDVLFQSATIVYESNLTGIILSGANNDGSTGIESIKDNGGITIVQDPKTAEYAIMPQFAINTNKIDYILSINEIVNYINKI